MKRWLIAACAALNMGGCASQAVDGPPMQQRITTDIAAFNEAYAEAANNLILWNVLRARDRLPRTYVAIKEITTSQSRSVEHTWGLESLNLGGDFGADPWGVGALGGTSSQSNEPNYGISPLVADDIGRAVLSPTPPRVFSVYWDAWGTHDVLLSVLVSRAVQLPADAARTASSCLRGEPNIDRDTPLQQFVAPLENSRALYNQIDEPGDVAHGAAFNRFARWTKENSDRTRLHFIETYRCRDVVRIPFGGTGQRDAAEAREFAQAIVGEGGRIAQGEGNIIDVRPRPSIQTVLLEITGTSEFAGVWELELRSLDQAIFYLGESVRQPANAEEYAAWSASRSHTETGDLPPQPATPSAFGRVAVVAADCSDEHVDGPLFRVWRSEPRRVQTQLFGDSSAPREPGWQFDRVRPAARVLYRGAIYEAGQPSPINSSCRAPADFSGSVLTLLSQLLAANQSPDAIRLPARFSN